MEKVSGRVPLAPGSREPSQQAVSAVPASIPSAEEYIPFSVRERVREAIANPESITPRHSGDGWVENYENWQGRAAITAFLMAQAARAVNAEPDELVTRLQGRAQFNADRGAIKDAGIQRQAATEIVRLVNLLGWAARRLPPLWEGFVYKQCPAAASGIAARSDETAEQAQPEARARPDAHPSSPPPSGDPS